MRRPNESQSQVTLRFSGGYPAGGRASARSARAGDRCCSATSPTRDDRNKTRRRTRQLNFQLIRQFPSRDKPDITTAGHDQTDLRMVTRNLQRCFAVTRGKDDVAKSGNRETQNHAQGRIVIDDQNSLRRKGWKDTSAGCGVTGRASMILLRMAYRTRPAVEFRPSFCRMPGRDGSPLFAR